MFEGKLDKSATLVSEKLNIIQKIDSIKTKIKTQRLLNDMKLMGLGVVKRLFSYSHLASPGLLLHPSHKAPWEFGSKVATSSLPICYLTPASLLAKETKTSVKEDPSRREEVSVGKRPVSDLSPLHTQAS